MVIDVFEQATLDGLVQTIKQPTTFLRDRFFGEETVQEHSTDAILVDIEVEGEKLAAFVSSEEGAAIVGGEGYASQMVKTPNIQMMTPLKPEDFINTRQPGSVGITAKSDQAFRKKVLTKLARELKSMKDRTTRTEEWMAAQALFNGKWSVTLPQNGKKYTIDFKRPAEHDITLTGSDLWTDHVNADPLGLIDLKSRLITQSVGIQPTCVIMDKTTKGHFLACDKVQKALDNRGMRRGEVDTTKEELQAGAKKFAELDGINYYEYDSTYIDYDGTRKSFVPDGKIVLTGKCDGNRRHYGPIKDFDAMPNIVRRYFSKNWVQKMPSKWWLSLESHPLLAMHQPQAAVTIKVR